MPVSRGFTLIEVMAALVIGGLLVLAAHQTLGSVIDHSRPAGAARRRHQALHAARVRLEQVAEAVDAAAAGGVGFTGDDGSARFAIRTAGPAGLDTVTLRLEAGWLVLARADGSAESLVPAAELSLEYLLDFGARSRWVRQWQSPVSAPLAIRLALMDRSGAADTLLLLIGPRG